MSRKTQELESTLAQRDNEITNLKQYIQAISAQLEEYQRKERAIGETLTEAQSTASLRVDEADRRGKAIIAAAEQEQAQMRQEMEEQREAANREAAAIVEAGQAECDRRLAQVKADTESYEERLKSFNASLSELADRVRQESEKFAAFLEESKMEPDHELINEIAATETPEMQPEQEPEQEQAAEEVSSDTFSLDDVPTEEFENTIVFTPVSAERPEAQEGQEERVWTTEEVLNTDETKNELDKLLDEILQDEQ